MKKIQIHNIQEISPIGLQRVLDYLGVELVDEGADVVVEASISNHLTVTGKTRVLLTYATVPQFFRGIGHIVEHWMQEMDLDEKPVFERLGASFDLSRNSVLRVETMEALFIKMAIMGYDEVYLYTEETYTIEQQPLFGYLRGRLSKKEIQRIDSYASSLGLNLIPCIQTLGHLERFLHWNNVAHLRDTHDVLLAGSEDVYLLIEQMLKSVRASYTSKVIHVGMDEAMNLGLGRYLQEFGYKDSYQIMQEHIERVVQLCKKYDFHPMMWSDMYFRAGSKTHDYYDDNVQIPENIIADVNPEIDLVYWDYYHTDKSFYDRYIKIHQKFKCKTIFAGGMWTWIGPAIDLNVFLSTSIPALESCVEQGIDHVILTSWGDDGGEVNIHAMLLSLQIYAEYKFKGNYNQEAVDCRATFCTGIQPEFIRLLSKFNRSNTIDKASDLPNIVKVALYQDPLIGIYDEDLKGLQLQKHFRNLSRELKNVLIIEANPYKIVYDFYIALSEFLEVKSELGIKLLHAYQLQDEKRMRIVLKDAKKAVKRAKILKESWKTMWFSTNKSFGFEVLEIRLAGIVSRLESTIEIVNAYINKEISEIDSLEEQRICIQRKANTTKIDGVYFYRQIVSSSLIN